MWSEESEAVFGECFAGGPVGHSSYGFVVLGDSHLVSEESDAVCGGVSFAARIVIIPNEL